MTNKISLFVKITLTSFVILFSFVSHLNSKEPEPDNPDEINGIVNYFYEPYPQKVNSSIFQIGGLITFVPIPLIEDEIPIPSVDMQYKRGIFDNTSFIGRYTTNFFSNILHLGIQGNMNTGNLSYGISNHIGSFLGFFSLEGQFSENWGYSVFYMASAKMGYRFDGFSLSASLSGIYLLKTVSKVSDIREMRIDNQWNDFFFTIALEQPFMKNQKVSIGFSVLFTRTPYQMWFLYNTIDEYLIEPEFFFAFQL